MVPEDRHQKFQSSFELTGYITIGIAGYSIFQKRLFQSSFELTGYITKGAIVIAGTVVGFKALSSLRVI